MIKTKVDFLEGWLLSSQSEQSKRFSKSSDWLEKSHLCFDHVNKIHVNRMIESLNKKGAKSNI